MIHTIGFLQFHSTIDVDLQKVLCLVNNGRQKCVPSYLTKFLENYFLERTRWYDTDEGPKQYTNTAEVPQASMLSPLLWNVM